MAAVALLGTIMVILLTVFNQGSKTFREGEAHIEKIIAGRVILEMMARELKGAMINGYETDDVGPDIKFLGENTYVQFVSPIENFREQYLCNLGYQLSGNTLERHMDALTAAEFPIKVGKVWNWSSQSDPLWENVSSLLLWYWKPGTTTEWYNSSGNPTGLPRWDSDLETSLPAAILIELEVTDTKDSTKRELYSTVVYLENAR